MFGLAVCSVPEDLKFRKRVDDSVVNCAAELRELITKMISTGVMRTVSLGARFLGGLIAGVWLMLLLEYPTELGDRVFVVFVSIACLGLCVAWRLQLIGAAVTMMAVVTLVVLKEISVPAVILLALPALAYLADYLLIGIGSSSHMTAK